MSEKSFTERLEDCLAEWKILYSESQAFPHGLCQRTFALLEESKRLSKENADLKLTLMEQQHVVHSPAYR